MIEYLEEEGTKVCNQISVYSRTWKQPTNVSKTVAQVFFSQVKIPQINITMDGHKIEVVNSFKYLGFTWTSKLSRKSAIDKCVDNIQKPFIKLKWLRAGGTLTTAVLRTCFFTYSFPHFAWLFPLFPLLPKTQKEILKRKFRVAMRLVHRCQYIPEHMLFETLKENTLDFYVKKFIVKRLEQMPKSDLRKFPFYNDVFYWDDFKIRKGDH